MLIKKNWILGTENKQDNTELEKKGIIVRFPRTERMSSSNIPELPLI